MKRDYDKLCKLLDLKTGAHVDTAAHFLESRGQVFCLHFGTEDAIEKAQAIIEAELMGARVQ